MLDFTKEETSMLLDDGYVPAYMMDVREGDLVAIAPVMRTNFNGIPIPVKTLSVQRLMSLGSDYQDENGMRIEHRVIMFIGMDMDNLPEHCSYGNTYPCFIKREAEVA